MQAELGHVGMRSADDEVGEARDARTGDIDLDANALALDAAEVDKERSVLLKFVCICTK